MIFGRLKGLELELFTNTNTKEDKKSINSRNVRKI